jgi:hypothetical protein|tara:strand:+ start:206 stop:451 length:246 start_codon:yes stop_codon:yes gene_type:complete
MTIFPISGNPFDTQATDSGRTMAEDFMVQDDEDRLNRIAYFRQRIIEEQHNQIIAAFKSTLDVCDERIARYRKIIKTLEGE